MKILQLIQKSQLRGAEIFACQLSNSLISNGHEVKVVSLFSGQAEMPFSDIECLEADQNKRLFDIRGLRNLSKLIEHHKPHIIQANAGDTLKYAALSKRIFGWKTPLVFRNANKMGDFIDSKPKQIFNQFLVNQCQGIASVSELCRLDFIKTFNYSESKTRTLPIGTNRVNQDLAFPKDLEFIRLKGPLLVNVGSLVEEKNHKGLLLIFRDIIKTHPEAQLLIVGDGNLRDSLESSLVELDLSESVYLLGFRSDALNIIGAADVFLMPSFIEGLPGVILESFMMRTPVIANDVGGISEVVKDRETGMLVAKDSPVEFVESVLEVLTHSDLREDLVNNAHLLVVNDYNNTSIAQKFGQFYQEIVSNSL